MKPFPRPLGLCLTALSLLVSGCATLASGPNQRIPVVTEPPGATVRADGIEIVSPGVLELPRSARRTLVSIELEGYAPHHIVLTRKTNEVVWLDWLGLPAAIATSAGEGSGFDVSRGPLASAEGMSPGEGFAVDYSSGAAYRLEPSRIEVTLERSEKP